jgi:WD40 repeat protein
MSVGAAGPRERPKPFADDWASAGTPRPPATIPNPLGPAGRIEVPTLSRSSVGARFRRYTPEEIASVPSVDAEGGIALSPDGAEVTFAWDRSGDLEIYTAPIFGDRIIRLTEAATASHAPRWSPDALWVAFLRADDDGRDALWLVDRDGEREHRLTRDAGYRDHAWSPDGARIAAAADDGGLRLIDVSTGEAARAASGARPQWSPNGSWILVTSGDDLALVPAGGGDPRALGIARMVGGRVTDGRWSRDGSTIAFCATSGGRSSVAFAHVRDGAAVRIERLGATPFDDRDPAWRPDGRGVIYRRTTDAAVSLRRVFTVSHTDEAVADVPGVHRAAHVAPDSETVVALLSQATLSTDVVVRARAAIETTRITTSLPPSIDPAALVDPVAVRYPSDRTVLVYLPHVEAGDVKGVTLLRRAALREWDPVAQALVAAGHVVVASPSDGAARALAGTAFEGATARSVEVGRESVGVSRDERARSLDAIVTGVTAV